MVEDKYFQYQDNINIQKVDTLCLEVDNIKSKTDVMNLFSLSLKFPDYFGYNWDALKDSLSYLDNWLTEKKIFIIHKELPHIEEIELFIYIRVLYDVCELWAKYPDVLEFKVFFPIESKSIVQEILKDVNSRFDI